MIPIEGHWAADFAPVARAFAENFATEGEQGAALAIYHRGDLVVNIWAGSRDNAAAGLTGVPWEENTCANIYSASKGLVALCVMQLVAAGKLALDEPVSRYWPEFAQSDKAGINLRQILCHRAGLSAFHDRRRDPEIFDWSCMTAAVAAESPWWEPGSDQGYSPFIFGWILGELIRRVSGYESFNSYFQAQVAGPLTANCHFGLSEAQLPHVADTAPLKRSAGVATSDQGADSASLGRLMKADPRGVSNRAFANPMTLMTAANTAAWRQAQIPAANGHASALGLARVYNSLATGAQIPATSRALAWEEQSAALDRVLGVPLRFSCGFMLTQSRPDCQFGRGHRAFGHPGAGGSLGFADPDFGIGFGYVTSRLGQSLLIDKRVIKLIHNLYGVPGVAE